MPEAEHSAAPAPGTATPHPAADAATLPAKRGGDQFFYGGQAVIEGLMMRGKRHYAVAVRLPNTKEIVVAPGELHAALYVHPFWKLPFVPGLPLIAEPLHLGTEALIC